MAVASHGQEAGVEDFGGHLAELGNIELTQERSKAVHVLSGQSGYVSPLHIHRNYLRLVLQRKDLLRDNIMYGAIGAGWLQFKANWINSTKMWQMMLPHRAHWTLWLVRLRQSTPISAALTQHLTEIICVVFSFNLSPLCMCVNIIYQARQDFIGECAARRTIT